MNRMGSRDEYIALIQGYLEASAARHLEEAKSYLADDIEIVFPEGRFASLEALVASAGRRYQWVKKVYHEWDVFERPDGSAVVVSTGTLYGVNLQGVPFEGVRYLDRFVIRNGKITSQQAWNDLAESEVLSRRQP